VSWTSTRAFLLLIRESLTDSVRGEIGRVGQSDLVMLIVGAADPKSGWRR